VGSDNVKSKAWLHSTNSQLGGLPATLIELQIAASNGIPS
jgi:hypothetical protein